MKASALSNSIIYFSPSGKLTGTLIDSLDYFHALHINNIDCTFISIGIKLKTINDICISRYTKLIIPDNKFIHLHNRIGLMKFDFDRVLLSYSSLKRVHLFLKHKKLLVLPSQLMRYDYENNNIVSPENAIFLLDPDQHPYKLNSRVDYKKKILLSEISTTGNSDNNVLISCISEHKRHNPREIVSIIENLDIRPKNILILGKSRFSNNRIIYLKAPVPHLFDIFKYYLYLPSLTGYDENPRLLIESAWLNKEILLPIALKRNDGAYLKWENIKNNVNEFNLTADDLVIKYFMNYQ